MVSEKLSVTDGVSSGSQFSIASQVYIAGSLSVRTFARLGSSVSVDAGAVVESHLSTSGKIAIQLTIGRANSSAAGSIEMTPGQPSIFGHKKERPCSGKANIRNVLLDVVWIDVFYCQFTKEGSFRFHKRGCLSLCQSIQPFNGMAKPEDFALRL